MASPYCLAMVLCEAAHRDSATGKITILGTFSAFVCPKYPAQVKCVVYYAITDGLGKTDLSIRLVDAKTDLVDQPGDSGVVFEAGAEVVFDSPLEVKEGIVNFITVLPAVGQYHCELWANKELLMSRRFLALTSGDES